MKRDLKFIEAAFTQTCRLVHCAVWH